MSVTHTDKLQQAHERLTEAAESIASGDDWQRMLEVVSKFHRYSTGGVTYSNCLNPLHQQAGVSSFYAIGDYARWGAVATTMARRWSC
jgi:hypothetical protein